MAPKALIVLISGIENCGEPLDNKTRDRGRQFVQERLPGSDVMVFDVFPDSKLEFLTEDHIRGKAIEVMSKLENSSKKPPVPVVFMANNIGAALVKQILLLSFERAEHQWIAYRTVCMFFAEYPNSRETVDHKQFMLGLVSDHKHKLSPQTFPVLLNVLPHALYIVDNDFAAIESSYLITHVSPMKLESDVPKMRETFLTIDNIISTEHIQLFPDYETFLVLCSRLGSSLRRAQSLREEIDSTAWVLDHAIFQKWQENAKFPILFISSPPGFGSTILSSSVPSLIESERRKHGSHFEMYLSFSFNRWDIRCDSERSFVASIIHQALILRPKLFQHIRGVCTLISDQHLHSISCDRLWSLFRQILFESQERCVFLIVNSVDQCGEPAAGEPGIVERLSSLTKDRKISGKVKILVTGRARTEMIESCNPLYINLPDDPAWKAGIRKAVSKRILHIVSMRPVWKDYAEDITNKFCCGDYNYFNTMLRAKLLESTKIPSTRASLQLNVPIESMDQVFYTLLSNLENPEMAKEALNWIFHATRPLTVSELSVAIALTSICNEEKADEPMPKEAESRLTVLEEAISWDPKRDLQGLIGNVIKLVGNVGEVCLTHSIFRQYFESSKEFFIPQFHAKIARRCLTYMSTVTEHLAKSSDSRADKTRILALLGYADINWTVHYKLSVHPIPLLAQRDMATLLDSRVMEFLWQEEATAWFKRLKPSVNSDLPITNPLIMAAEGGLTGIVMTLLRPPMVIIEENIKAALETAVRRGDSHIYGLLLPHLLPQKLAPYVCLAAEYGHTALVTRLLSQMDSKEIEILAEKEVLLAESPSLLAAQNGHMKTLIAILDRLPERAIEQVDPLTLSNVVNWAAAWGDSEALEAFESRSGWKAASMTSQDSRKLSPLRLAAQAGCLDAVEFVLKFADKDVIEQKDEQCLSALHVASLEGHVAIVERLIKAGADVMAMNDTSKCSLEFAAEEGHLPVFALLFKEMKQQLENKKTGEDSKKEIFLKEHLHTSLLNAISHGHTDIIHHILRQNNRIPEKDPELMNSAVRSGHLDAIKALVNANIKFQETQEEGQVLLMKAILDDRVDIVRYLVKAGIKVKADTQYLLHHVAESGNRSVMRELLLLPQAKDLLRASDYVGDKPLDVAVRYGREGVAKELLKTNNLALLGLGSRRPFRTLFRAIEGGRVEIVKLLLAKDWEVDCRDAESNTPLHKATRDGLTEIVKLFLHNKKILNEKNDAGDTPLHIAVSERNLEIFRFLLDNQADPNLRDSDGLSVLHLLCSGSRHYSEEWTDEWLRELFSSKGSLEAPREQRVKINIDLPTSDDRTALHFAIKSKSLTEIILNQKPTVDAVITETQDTPLMLASERSDAGVIKLLLKATADPNKRNKAGQSALDKAIKSDQLPNVEALVEGGAQVNSRKNEDDPTPLYAAVSKNSLPIVSYLLKKGADPNLFGGDFYSPLEYAAYQEEKKIVKALLEYKDINVNAGSAEHGVGSVLHAALISRSQEIFDWLMDQNANVHAIAMPYGTPLHLTMIIDFSAEETRHFVNKLIEKGAKIEDLDLGGRSTLSLAVSNAPVHDIEYLLDLKADPDVPDHTKSTPIHYAAMMSNDSNLKKLLDKSKNLEMLDGCNRSILYRAAMSGDLEKFTTVLNKLPESCRQQHLATAIFPAVARGKLDIVEKIFEGTGIDLNAVDRNGWTPLEIAKAYEYEEVVTLLEGKIGRSSEAKSRTKLEPTKWNRDDIGPTGVLSENDLIGSIKGVSEQLFNVGTCTLRANACMPNDSGTFYFEVTILQAGLVAVGFCEEYAVLDRFVGLTAGTWGYHSDDGSFYKGTDDSGVVSGSGPNYGQKYGGAGKEPDVIGCGVDFRKKTAFFTHNGEHLGTAFENIVGQLYPAVSLAYATTESRVQVNFDKSTFRYKVEEGTETKPESEPEPEPGEAVETDRSHRKM